MPSVSPGPIVERHAVDRPRDAVLGEEVGLEVLDLEQRRAPWLASHAPRDARVEPVAQPVADEVDREHDQRQRQPRAEHGPRRPRQIGRGSRRSCCPRSGSPAACRRPGRTGRPRSGWRRRRCRSPARSAAGRSRAGCGARGSCARACRRRSPPRHRVARGSSARPSARGARRAAPRG